MGKKYGKLPYFILGFSMHSTYGEVEQEKVIEFYKENAFFPIENNHSSESIKMIKPYF